MYNKVYARSSAAMSGGSSANDPAVDPSALASAQAQMRSRLEEKARAAVQNITRPSITFPELTQIQYQDLPSTPEGTASVRVHVKAHVAIPILTESDLATAIVRWAKTDPQGASLTLVPGAGFAVTLSNASSSQLLGVMPVTFSIAGSAMVVWQVDASTVASSLAGKDKDAFQTIVNGIPSIQEAKARIEPFWSRSFPSNPNSISVVIKEAGEGQ